MLDHLRATVGEVPVPDADYRKQYLVIYDSVPWYGLSETVDA